MKEKQIKFIIEEKDGEIKTRLANDEVYITDLFRVTECIGDMIDEAVSRCMLKM